MVMITSQLAAIIATGIAVSGASAAALPSRNHARAQQQVRMSLDAPGSHQYGRRSVPIAPLPASVSADLNNQSGQANSKAKVNKVQPIGNGKGKTRKAKPGNNQNDKVNVDAKVQDSRIQARAQVEIGNDDDDARKPGPAKPQSNSSNNGKPKSNPSNNNKPKPKPNTQPGPKPQPKPQAQSSKPKPGTQSQKPKAQPKVNPGKQDSDNGSLNAGAHADDQHDGNVAGSAGINKRDHKHHHHQHHHHHHNGKRDDHVHIHEHDHDSHHHHHGHHDVHKHVHKHSSRSVKEGQAPRSLLGRAFKNSSARRSRGPRRLETEKAKRALIKVGSTNARPAYYYDSENPSLLHVGIGKRTPTHATVSANVQIDTSLKQPVTGSATINRVNHRKRGLFTTRGRQSVGSTLEALASLAGRDVKDESHVHRRDSQSGVEGVINIVSAVAGSSTGEKIASLLLSSDTPANNAFVLNASNSSATHVFLVPANSTAATTSEDGSIPVVLQVPVYSPDKASMVNYCMTYDPNPPAPSPLTAQGCTDQVTDHQSQVFAYNPSSGVIVPMWTVAPSSTDPSAASDDPATSSAAATSSVSASASSTAISSSATDSASTTSSAAPSKRSSTPDASAAEAEDPNCDDADSLSAASAGNSTMAPQDVTLIFTPSNAAGILPSTGESAKDMTTFFPPGSTASDDGNVGASSAATSATDATGEEDDGEDDEDPADAADDSDVSPSSVDPNAQDPTTTDSAAGDDASAVDAASVDASPDVEETMTDDEVTPTPSSNSSPSMTPVPDASTPYSWMFTPQK